MASKPRALTLLGTLICPHWRIQWVWQQPLLYTQTRPLRSCGHCDFFASNSTYVNQAVETPPSPSSPAEKCGTAGETPKHRVVGEERPLASSWKKSFLFVGRLGLCGPLVNTDVLKERGGLALASALPERRFSSGRRRLPGGGVKISPCKEEGCTVKGAAYGFPDNSPTRCKKHCLKGMVRLKDACEAPGCNTQPTFAFPPNTKGGRCAAHKLEGMVNYKLPTCHIPECTKAALFGPVGAGHPRLCQSHREEGMIRIYHLRNGQCQFQHGCKFKAMYGYESDRIRKFCLKHREPEMVNLESFWCTVGGCKIQASYGWADQKGVQRCADHREEGMVQKTSKRCEFEGCGKWAWFGFPGETSRLCGQHMEEGMRNLTRHVCAVSGCERYAYYGLEGDQPSRCGEHKGEGMVNVAFRLCGVDGCKTVAVFRMPGKVASRCKRHKEEGMVRSKQGEASGF